MANFNNQQFRNVFDLVAVRKYTIDVASLVDGAGATSAQSFPGAALGDFVLASFGVDLAGITVTAYVSSANNIAIRVQNESGGTLDLASTTVKVIVLRLKPGAENE